MDKKKKLVFATNNAHKLEEARQIISDKFEIVSLAEIGCHDDIPETADTLCGNALIKARWVKERYGYDCFSDDTGLMVEALGGAPGVLSARYAGEHCTPADNVKKLLAEMQDKENRRAYFATVVALICDGAEHTFEGRVDGEIAREAAGNQGFGYDPVFVADESGRRFAEMSADEKNSISHRGRAMRKLRDFLGIFMMILMLAGVYTKSHAEQWRLHASYDDQMERVIDTPDYVYFLGTKQKYNPSLSAASTFFGTLFRYDKSGEEMQYLNSQNQLSGDTPVAIEYNFDKRYLAVAYDDGDIDLVYDSGKTVNVPGLRISDPSISKSVNSITFDKSSNSVLFATKFGYVRVNDQKGEIETSRIYGKNVKACGILGDKLVVGLEDGIYVGSSKEFSFDNFAKVIDGKEIIRFIQLNPSSLYVLAKENGLKHCYRLVNNGGTYDLISIGDGNVTASLERGVSGVLQCAQYNVWWYDASGKGTRYKRPSEDIMLIGASSDGKAVWLSNGRKGVTQKKLPAETSGEWIVQKDYFRPNAATSFQCSTIVPHPEYGLLVRNHGKNYNFNETQGNYFNVDDLICGYKDMTWTPLSATYRNPMTGLKFDNPDGAAVDPNNPNHVYCGSHQAGMLRLDLKNPEKSIHMSLPSDFSNGYGQPGFVAVVPDNPESFWKYRCHFSAPVFDASGNLWVAYNYPIEDLRSTTELWVWTPEKRAAVTSADNFQPWYKIRIKNLQMNLPKLISLTTVRNVLLFAPNDAVSTLLMYSHAGTPEVTSDDSSVIMTSFHDQDGNITDFRRIVCMYEDTATGLVWLGTESGVYTFSPTDNAKGEGSLRRIKVSRNDGTNLADYLLDGISVNAIISDKQGRKWMGTTDAGLICTSADGKTILRTYTTDNSEIPGNSVYAICHNQSNNSLMISTEKGLAELFLGGTATSGGEDTARAYPNPVRPDYYGYVTIDNLPENAIVKIVDTAGNLVKECGEAESGEVQWDMTNIFHKRVPAGIYFIMATNGADSSSFAKVSKVMVIE